VNAVLRAEVRRVVATPALWWLLLGTAAIGVVGTLAPLIAADGDAAEMLTDHDLQQAMHGAAAGAILVLVAGVIGMAGDWRHGQATQAFLTTPRRARVVAAKTITFMGVGAVYGVAAGAAAAATAWGWYRSEGLTLPVGRSAVWLTLLGCLAVAVLFGILGVAVGAVTRNQVAGIVGAVAWMVLVEPALFAASPRVFRWLPGTASFSLRRQPGDGLLAIGPAAAAILAVVVAASAIGWRLVERDDVTG
jgi:ABC-2 type transport system permease protein